MTWMRDPQTGQERNVESVLDPETHRSQIDILRQRGWTFVNENERIPVYMYDDEGIVRRYTVEAHEFDDVLGPGVGGGARTPELDRVIGLAEEEEARNNRREALSLSRMIGVPDELAALLSFTGPGMMANPAAAAATADTLSFGGVSALGRQVAPEATQWLHDVREANPYSDVAGELQGLVLPVPGDRSMRAGSAMSRLEQLMTAAGPSGAGQTVRRLIAERAIADLMGPAAVNQMRGRLTAGAIEGMAAGVATGFMDSMVQNSDLTGEIVASHAGLGALLGFGGEALIGGAQRAWRWARPGYNPTAAENLIDAPVRDAVGNLNVDDIYPRVINPGAQEAIRAGRLTQDPTAFNRLYGLLGSVFSTTDREALERVSTRQVQSLAAYARREIPLGSPDIARDGNRVLEAAEELSRTAGRSPDREVVNRYAATTPGATNRVRETFGSISQNFRQLSEELTGGDRSRAAGLARRLRVLSQGVTQQLPDGWAFFPQTMQRITREVEEAVPNAMELGLPMGATRRVQVVENVLVPSDKPALRGMQSEGALAYQLALNVRDDQVVRLLTHANPRIVEAADGAYSAIRTGLLGNEDMFGGAAVRLNAIERAFGNKQLPNSMPGHKGAFDEHAENILNRVGESTGRGKRFSSSRINSHFMDNIGPDDPTALELKQAMETFTEETDRSIAEVARLYEDTTDRAVLDRLQEAAESFKARWKSTIPMAEAFGLFQTVWRSRNQGSGAQLGMMFGMGTGVLTGSPALGFGAGMLAAQLAAPGSVPFIIGGLRNTIAEFGRTQAPRVLALKNSFRSAARVGSTLGAAGRRAMPTYVTRLGNRQEREEQYNEIRERVYELSANPMQLAEELNARTFYINHADPVVAGEMQQAAVRSLALLRNLITEPVTDPSSGRPLPTSAYEVDAVVDTVEALEDPMRLIDHFVEHTLSAEHVNAVRTVYPSTFAAMQGLVSQVQQEVLMEGRDIPFQTKAQLSILFGTDMDVALSGSFTAAMQSNYAQTTAGAETIQEPDHRPRMRRPRLAESTRTGSQQVEEGL